MSLREKAKMKTKMETKTKNYRPRPYELLGRISSDLEVMKQTLGVLPPQRSG
jgi:hypothetical protein